jgi:hypothetical protein
MLAIALKVSRQKVRISQRAARVTCLGRTPRFQSRLLVGQGRAVVALPLFGSNAPQLLLDVVIGSDDFWVL